MTTNLSKLLIKYQSKLPDDLKEFANGNQRCNNGTYYYSRVYNTFHYNALLSNDYTKYTSLITYTKDIKEHDETKFKNLLDNKVYKAQMERLASNISEAVKSSKVWGVIGFTTFLGVFVAILIAVQRKDIPAPSAPIIANYFLTGCYMVYGDGKNPTVVKLDGCSSWYSNSNENSLYCKCGNTKSISEIKCSGDDKNLPFCIGKPGDTSGATKCSVPNVENYDLDVCKGQIGKEGPFVYYTSHIADALAMLPHMVQIIQGSTSTTTNDYNTENKTKNTMGLVGKILLGVIIIVTLLILGIIIYNTFFQNRNMIKSMSRR
jgi:hypothetical protein